MLKIWNAPLVVNYENFGPGFQIVMDLLKKFQDLHKIWPTPTINPKVNLLSITNELSLGLDIVSISAFQTIS